MDVPVLIQVSLPDPVQRGSALEWLEEHARAAGTAPAVTSNGRAITFLELKSMVAAAAVQIADNPNLTPGSIMILSVADPIQQWVLILAAMRCGLAPCPMVQPNPQIAGLAKAFVLCDPERHPDFIAQFGADRCLTAPTARADDTGTLAKASDHNPIGIVLLSSGTTGAPKAVPLSHAAILQRTVLRDDYFPVTGGLVSLMHPGFAGGLQSCLTALKNGVPVDISDRIDAIIDAVNSPGPAQLVGSPAQLMTLIGEMRSRKKAGNRITRILTMGGLVAPKLVSEAQAVFGCPMISLYGTTELGACAIGDPQVPDQGMAILNGVAVSLSPLDGALRLKAPGMAETYLEGTAEGTTRFEAGWFVPGDLGRISDGRLWIDGRGSEIVNVGGQKLDPARMDAALADLSIADDIATFGYTTADGDPMLMIAIVAASDGAYAEAKRLIRSMGLVAPPSLGFFRVDRIPRAGLGKPARDRLAGMVKAALVRR